MVPLSLVLVRLKQRQIAPVVMWPWWVVLAPFWVPVVLFIGFGLAWLLMAIIIFILNGARL
ncbi:hypothetical protein [uncultured Hymenobacter sp.]|uniref:hypothetical protein n=1 Tax=uncultured Hymenobacter sp. TaxID=170016 RepID=UPI0035CA861D